MKGIQAIFFDFDGVILESVSVKGWAFGKLFERYTEQVDEIVTFHYANGGVSRFDKFRYIYKNILKKELSAVELERLCESFSNLVYKRVLECNFVPGTKAFLDKYYKPISFYIISGTPHEEIVKIVDAKGLSRYFKGVFGSPTGKSEWTKKIICDNHFDQKRVVFVGDTLSDYEAATENGVHFVARIANDNGKLFDGVGIKYFLSDLILLNEKIGQIGGN